VVDGKRQISHFHLHPIRKLHIHLWKSLARHAVLLADLHCHCVVRLLLWVKVQQRIRVLPFGLRVWPIRHGRIHSREGHLTLHAVGNQLQWVTNCDCAWIVWHGPHSLVVGWIWHTSWARKAKNATQKEHDIKVMKDESAKG
jgi:hypothetical protein